MTVFIVTVTHWEDAETVGVFSTLENAEVFVATLGETDRINVQIAEWAVN
jgi:hypothetical protein